MNYLFIIDMQNDFIDGKLGTPEAKAIVEPAAKYIKDFDKKGSIIVTQDTHQIVNYTFSQEGIHLPIRHCVEYTEGQKLNKEIQEALWTRNNPDVYYISKSTFGFPYWSRERDSNDTITIIGLCTDICVISNALILRSMYPETPISVISNLCAGTSPEAHEAALQVMRNNAIDVKEVF